MKKWYKKRNGEIVINDPQLLANVRRLARFGRIFTDGKTARQINQMLKEIGQTSTSEGTPLLASGWNRKSRTSIVGLLPGVNIHVKGKKVKYQDLLDKLF